MREDFAPFNPFEYLQTPEAVWLFLQDLQADHDPELLEMALQDAIDWFGAEEVADRAGVDAAALDAALAAPEFDTLYRLLMAFARADVTA